MGGMAYARGKHYNNTTELEVAVRAAWAAVSSDYIFKLYRSISKRLLAVVDGKGTTTKY